MHSYGLGPGLGILKRWKVENGKWKMEKREENKRVLCFYVCFVGFSSLLFSSPEVV